MTNGRTMRRSSQTEAAQGDHPTLRSLQDVESRCHGPPTPALHVLFSFPPFFHQEEMSSISSRYSVFNCRIAFATADSCCLE